MWLMLQNNEPKDYVISSNKNYSVKEFIEKTFKLAKINIKWKGNGLNEIGYDTYNNILIKIDKKYYRPTEVDFLLGDSSLIRKELKWTCKYSFDDLILDMVKNDCKNLNYFSS